MAVYVPACSGGDWVQMSKGLQCTGTIQLIDSSILTAPFSFSQVDLVVAGQCFAAGFSLVASCILIGIAVRTVLHVIKY